MAWRRIISCVERTLFMSKIKTTHPSYGLGPGPKQPALLRQSYLRYLTRLSAHFETYLGIYVNPRLSSHSKSASRSFHSPSAVRDAVLLCNTSWLSDDQSLDLEISCLRHQNEWKETDPGGLLTTVLAQFYCFYRTLQSKINYDPSTKYQSELFIFRIATGCFRSREFPYINATMLLFTVSLPHLHSLQQQAICPYRLLEIR